MKTTYYRFGLNLISSKQDLNQTNENLFKIPIRTSKYVDLFVQLKIDDIGYPRPICIHIFVNEMKNNRGYL